MEMLGLLILSPLSFTSLKLGTAAIIIEGDLINVTFRASC